MRKPQKYDTVQIFGEWTSLTPGGHYLIILGAKETKAKTGRDMLTVQFDTDKNDAQPNYFRDNHTEGRWYQGQYNVMLGEEDWAVRNLKSLITSVERSNPGFKFDWDNPNCLRGKKIGGVFGHEEYLSISNEVKLSTRLRWFCSTDSVEGARVPDAKKLKTPSGGMSGATTPPPPPAFDDGGDMGLPFDL